jgi:predicted metal-dependent hydrolase
MSDNLIKVKSSKDNREYIVRDLPNAINAANKLSMINEKILLLIDHLDENKENVKRLKKNYRPDSLSENTKDSIHTSYSLNKGEKISLCLREKSEDIIFEDDNTIIFVVIHELAHLMSESIGHTDEFWDNMRYLLEESRKVGIYKVVDYKKENVEYCGMYIKSTPYDFEK